MIQRSVRIAAAGRSLPERELPKMWRAIQPARKLRRVLGMQICFEGNRVFVLWRRGGSWRLVSERCVMNEG